MSNLRWDGECNITWPDSLTVEDSIAIDYFLLSDNKN